MKTDLDLIKHLDENGLIEDFYILDKDEQLEIIQKHEINSDEKIIFYSVFHEDCFKNNMYIIGEYNVHRLIITNKAILVSENFDTYHYSYLDNIESAHWYPDDGEITLFEKTHGLVNIKIDLFGFNPYSDSFEEKLNMLLSFWDERILDNGFEINFTEKVENFLIDHITQYPLESWNGEKLTKKDSINIIMAFDEFKETYNKKEYDIYVAIEYRFIIAQYSLGNHTEAIQSVTDSINQLVEFSEEQFALLYLKAIIEYETGLIDRSLYTLSHIIRNTKDAQFKVYAKEKFNKLAKIYKKKFLNKEYKDRRLILFAKELIETSVNTFAILTNELIPDGIKLPHGLHEYHELYIGHPYIKEIYFPFSDYQTQLAEDKVNEFFYFLQCLGAKKIKYKITEGWDEITDNDKKINLSGEANIKIHKIDAQLGNDSQSKTKKADLNSNSITQIHQPSKKPYLPSELIWFPHELSWQRIYKQRLEGNLLYHHQKISSKSTSSISDAQKNTVKVSYENLLVKLNIDIATHIEYTFDSNLDKEWEFEIEFEDIENLK